MTLLHDYIGVDDRKTINFMTDRQKGVLRAITEIFPAHKNKYCARHLYKFKAKYPSVKIKNLFWAASKATCAYAFSATIEEIRSVNEQAYEWLMDIPSCHWSRQGFDVNAKLDHVTNIYK